MPTTIYLLQSFFVSVSKLFMSKKKLLIQILLDDKDFYRFKKDALPLNIHGNKLQNLLALQVFI